MADSNDSREPTLDETIERAQGLTTALGAVFLIASVLQAFGIVKAGVPAPLNIAISVSVLVLAQLLPRKSIPLAGALGVIFLILAIDTLLATGFVLESWGAVATTIVVIRYLLLLSATQGLGQVVKLLLVERKMALRLAELRASAEQAVDVNDEAPIDDRQPRAKAISRAGQLRIEMGKNSTAIVLRMMSGILLVAGLIFGSSMMSFGETGVALIGFIVPPLMAAGLFFVAGMEERYVPGLVASLQNAVEEGNIDLAAETRTKLIATKGHGARRLAAKIVNERIPIESAFAQTALETIAKIGTLDDDAAYVLRRAIGEESNLPAALRQFLFDAK